MGLFATTDPRAVHSAWVFLIFGCGDNRIGHESLTALVEVKLNSLILAALLFNFAKDLSVFSITPLSRSREIEFRCIVGRHPNRLGASDKNVKYGHFCHNNSKFYLLLYFYQRNVATAVLV